MKFWFLQYVSTNKAIWDWIFVPLKTEWKQLPVAELAVNCTQYCELSFALHHDLGAVHGHRQSAAPSPELNITGNFTTCETWVSFRLSIDCANRGARKKLGFVVNLIASHWVIFKKYQQRHERQFFLVSCVLPSHVRSFAPACGVFYMCTTIKSDCQSLRLSNAFKQWTLKTNNCWADEMRKYFSSVITTVSSVS